MYWDSVDCSPIRELEAADGELNTCDISASGKYFASGGNDSAAKVCFLFLFLLAFELSVTHSPLSICNSCGTMNSVTVCVWVSVTVAVSQKCDSVPMSRYLCLSVTKVAFVFGKSENLLLLFFFSASSYLVCVSPNLSLSLSLLSLLKKRI